MKGFLIRELALVKIVVSVKQHKKAQSVSLLHLFPQSHIDLRSITTSQRFATTTKTNTRQTKTFMIEKVGSIFGTKLSNVHYK